MITLKKDKCGLYGNREDGGNFRQWKHFLDKKMEMGIRKKLKKREDSIY